MEAIKVNNVSKSFKVYHDKGTTLKEKIIFKERNKFDLNKVLNSINLTINKGEVVGIIGKNGSGKSTLLKLITRIIFPDTGTIEVKGKVSSLLELGAGFHPDLTGRENIYTNASIFGLTKKDTDKRLDTIINFSELGDFIDAPVRTYSSGMYMRLAFSVAINVDADVLLIDEILSVGDASFQAKCFNKLQEIKKRGTTIVIVSHDMGSIQKLCSRAVWIHEGKLYRDTNPYDIEGEYLDVIMNNTLRPICEEVEGTEEETPIENNYQEEQKKNIENRHGNKFVEITKVGMYSEGVEKYNFKTGDDAIIKISYQRNNIDIDKAVFGFAIYRNDGLSCYGSNTQIEKHGAIEIKESGIIDISIDNISLIPNQYILEIAIVAEDHTPYDFFKNVKTFDVYSDKHDVGVFRIKHKWIV